MTAVTESPTIPTVLVIDDDNEIRYSLDRVLSSRGYRVRTAGSGMEGLELLRRETPEVIFMDIRMEGMSGLETLQRLRAVDPQSVVILMTAFGTTQTAIEAMKFGAFDYIIKPFDVRKVLELTESAARARQGQQETKEQKPSLNSEDYREGIVGRSESMQEVFKLIGQVAPSDATVLVTGESGTGKELVARCIHQHSSRSRRPFVAVNCAAIPDNLIESELFGHERGAFTGATAQRIGRFEQCDGGTIFLDEIGDMALPTQTRILRVLQEGDIQRVGGSGTTRVDVRVLAATNRDLESMVAEGSFREDLYYRLNVVRLRLPPLRERMEDLPLLVDFLLQKLEKAGKVRGKRFAPDALRLIRRHSWPGNVRELENAVHRSAVMAQSDVIMVRDLPAEVRAGAEGSPAAVAAPAAEDVSPPPAPEQTAAARPEFFPGPIDEPAADLDALYGTLRRTAGEDILGAIEREMIVRALRETEGNQVKAAAILGITRTTLRKRIQTLDLKT